jgi:predicted ATPase
LIQGKATTEFAYDLRYTLAAGHIAVRIINPPAGTDRSSFAMLSDVEVTTFTFLVVEDGIERKIPRKDIPKYLPRYVVTYYSGVSNRMEHHFFQPQLEFRNELLEGNVIPLRPLFYAKPIHSHFALLAFFMTEEPEVSEFLRDYPWIDELESALFVLKRPHWAKGKKLRADGDARFWYAGGVVRDFLSCLYDCALAPLRLKGKIQHSFDEVENTEFLYLYLRDLDQLRKLARESVSAMYRKNKKGAAEQEFRAADFFKLLESTYMSDLIHETRIRVKVRHAGALTFRELSEGEQQLLTVVGMLRFTRDEDSLFLLDEPDTHLNPAWGIEYLSMLRKHAHTGQNSHLLVATHDPLVLTNLRKNQVSILERDLESGVVGSFEPDEDPMGMGVQGILRNMFGLRSAVGTEVQKKLDTRSQLLALKRRNKAQEADLQRLTSELTELGFGREFRDPDYAQFQRAMSRRTEYQKPVLTHSEQESQEKIADEILDDILSKDGKQ